MVPSAPRPRVEAWKGSEESPITSRQEEDGIEFTLPSSAPLWQRHTAHFLTNSLHLPETLVIWVFLVKSWVWVTFLVWCAGAKLASWLELGPIYVLFTIVAVIYWNLGKRKEGEASAYSIFNNFQALPGQLQADDIDHQVRRGQM